MDSESKKSLDITRLGHEKRLASAGWNHLALSVGSRKEVDRLAAQLAADRYYEFAFLDAEVTI